MADCLTGTQYAEFLVSQTPVFDELIIRDIRPTDGWIGHFNIGTWEAFSDTTHTYDRFRAVSPNVTKAWSRVQAGNCVGTPCDPVANPIGWGYERNEYFQEQISWRTDLLCFDQILAVTRAQEHFGQIVGDILKPATSGIISDFARKRVADYAKKKWVADANMTDFTFTWETTGDEEIYLNTTADPTSKLTPQMLQRQVSRLQYEGYFGKQPFKDMPPLIELVTDMNTVWDLDKSASDTNVSDRWRFQEWEAANRYYAYAFGGQLGNYVIRADPYAIRFNKISNGRYQRVLPYVNEPTTSGIGSVYNEDYDRAQYQFSYIWHRMAMMFLVAQTQTVNPLMPFANRSLAGEWTFAMDNLGADCNGVAISNYRRNKGFFFADFKVAAKPMYVEFAELIFHKREPAVVFTVDTCATDPGYPTQYYNDSNETCSDTSLFTPEPNPDGDFEIAASTITCDSAVVANAEIVASSIGDLVTALNSDGAASALGTWIQDNGGQLSLINPTCTNVVIPWVTT